MFLGLDVSRVFRDPDSFALATRFRLQNVRFVLFRSSIRLEVAVTKTFYFLHQSNLSNTHSAGRHQDFGKTLKSFGKSFSIRFMLRASKSFLHISDMPGKWLIFCIKWLVFSDFLSVYNLIFFHIHDPFQRHAVVGPVKIPILVLRHFFEPKTLRHAPHWFVLAVRRANVVPPAIGKSSQALLLWCCL